MNGTRKDVEAKPHKEEIEIDIFNQNKNEYLQIEEEERSSEKPTQNNEETRDDAKDEILYHICGPEFHNQDRKKRRPVDRKTLENNRYNKNTFVYFGDSDDPADFDDQDSRNAFVRIVFILLSIILLLTAVIVFLIHIFLYELFRSHGFIFAMPAAILIFLLSYVWACIPYCRQPPCGYFLLLVQVILTSILLGAITVLYDAIIIMIALVCLVIICLICVCLACTSFDFTSWYLYVVMAFLAMIVASMAVSIVVLVFKIKLTVVMIAITVASLVLQSILFVIELQMVFGGKSVELNENDFPFAAYLLYTSIVNMFLQILRLVGFSFGDDF